MAPMGLSVQKRSPFPAACFSLSLCCSRPAWWVSWYSSLYFSLSLALSFAIPLSPFCLTVTPCGPLWLAFHFIVVSLMIQFLSLYSVPISRPLFLCVSSISNKADLFILQQEFVVSPKAVSLEELYGHFDLSYYEWTDGILSTTMRQTCTGYHAKP